MKLLIDAGADVNCRNSLGLCPLTLATATGNYKILKLLTNSPTINLNAQVCVCVCVQERGDEKGRSMLGIEGVVSQLDPA